MGTKGVELDVRDTSVEMLPYRTPGTTPQIITDIVAGLNDLSTRDGYQATILNEAGRAIERNDFIVAQMLLRCYGTYAGFYQGFTSALPGGAYKNQDVDGSTTLEVVATLEPVEPDSSEVLRSKRHKRFDRYKYELLPRATKPYEHRVYDVSIPDLKTLSPRTPSVEQLDQEARFGYIDSLHERLRGAVIPGGFVYLSEEEYLLDFVDMADRLTEVYLENQILDASNEDARLGWYSLENKKRYYQLLEGMLTHVKMRLDAVSAPGPWDPEHTLNEYQWLILVRERLMMLYSGPIMNDVMNGEVDGNIPFLTGLIHVDSKLQQKEYSQWYEIVKNQQLLRIDELSRTAKKRSGTEIVLLRDQGAVHEELAYLKELEAETLAHPLLAELLAAAEVDPLVAEIGRELPDLPIQAGIYIDGLRLINEGGSLDFGTALVHQYKLQQWAELLSRFGLEVGYDGEYDESVGLKEVYMNVVSLGALGYSSERFTAEHLVEAITSVYVIRTYEMLKKIEELRKKEEETKIELIRDAFISAGEVPPDVELDESRWRLSFDRDRARIRRLYADLREGREQMQHFFSFGQTAMGFEYAGREKIAQAQLQAILNVSKAFMRYQRYDQYSDDAASVIASVDQGDIAVQCMSATRFNVQFIRELLDRIEHNAFNSSHAFVSMVTKQREHEVTAFDCHHEVGFFVLDAPVNGFQFGIVDYNYREGVLLVPHDAITWLEFPPDYPHIGVHSPLATKIQIDTGKVVRFDGKSYKPADDRAPFELMIYRDFRCPVIPDAILARELKIAGAETAGRKLTAVDDVSCIRTIMRFEEGDTIFSSESQEKLNDAWSSPRLFTIHYGRSIYNKQKWRLRDDVYAPSLLLGFVTRCLNVAKSCSSLPLQFIYAREYERLRVEGDTTYKSDWYDTYIDNLMWNLAPRIKGQRVLDQGDVKKFEDELRLYKDLVTEQDIAGIMADVNAKIEKFNIDYAPVEILEESLDMVHILDGITAQIEAGLPLTQSSMRSLQMSNDGNNAFADLDEAKRLSGTSVTLHAALSDMRLIPKETVRQIVEAMSAQPNQVRDLLVSRTTEWQLVIQALKLLEEQKTQHYLSDTSAVPLINPGLVDEV